MPTRFDGHSVSGKRSREGLSGQVESLRVENLNNTTLCWIEIRLIFRIHTFQENLFADG